MDASQTTVISNICSKSQTLISIWSNNNGVFFQMLITNASLMLDHRITLQSKNMGNKT